MKLYLRPLSYAKPYWKLLSLGIASTFILFLLSLAPPLFTKILVDHVLFTKSIELLDRVFLVLIVVFLVDLLLGFGNHYIFVKLNQLITYDVRMHFFEHLQKLSMKFYDKRRSGDLIYRLFGDTETIPGTVRTLLVDLFLYVITLGIVSFLMFAVNAELALFCLLIVPLHVLAVIGFRGPIKKYSLRLRQKDESISGDVVEYFSSMRMVKAFSSEQLERNRFADGQAERFRLGLQSSLVNKVSGLVVGSINNVLFFLVLWYGGYEVIREQMSLGDLMALLILVGRLYAPVSGITNIVLGFTDASVGINRVYEILDMPPNADLEPVERQPSPATPDLDGLRWEVEFRDVVFSYNGSGLVLNRVNLKVPGGTRVALVGRSGVGKTTMMNLLTGFYRPQEGGIYIDGHDIRVLPLKDLRMYMGIVLQDPYLFSGSVKDNILYGRPRATHAEVVDAAVKANAHAFIVKLPDQYDTKIGERGMRLSGGEKQRIAIARAFLRNPKMLILDEAMSSVDLNSELYIQEALKKLMEGRTCFIIAHRLSTIRNADMIAVVDSGGIVESGSHRELMNKKGLYFRMYESMATL